MRNDKRLEALETIKTSTAVRVILISFKCGSTGEAFFHGFRTVPDRLTTRPQLDVLQQRRSHGSLVESCVSVLGHIWTSLMRFHVSGWRIRPSTVHIVLVRSSMSISSSSPSRKLSKIVGTEMNCSSGSDSMVI